MTSVGFAPALLFPHDDNQPSPTSAESAQRNMSLSLLSLSPSGGSSSGKSSSSSSAVLELFHQLKQEVHIIHSVAVFFHPALHVFFIHLQNSQLATQSQMLI